MNQSEDRARTTHWSLEDSCKQVDGSAHILIATSDQGNSPGSVTTTRETGVTEENAVLDSRNGRVMMQWGQNGLQFDEMAKANARSQGGGGRVSGGGGGKGDGGGGGSDGHQSWSHTRDLVTCRGRGCRTRV